MLDANDVNPKHERYLDFVEILDSITKEMDEFMRFADVDMVTKDGVPLEPKWLVEAKELHKTVTRLIDTI